MDLSAGSFVENSSAVSDKRGQEGNASYAPVPAKPPVRKGLDVVHDYLGMEADGLPAGMLGKIIPILEERDQLRYERDLYGQRARQAEEAARFSLYRCLSRDAFLKEAAKRQRHCLDKGIDCSLILIRLHNYREIRNRHGAEGAQDALLNLSTLLASAVKDSDLLGLVFEYTFAMFIPFMDGIEANAFTIGLRDLVEPVPYLYHGCTVNEKIDLAAAGLGDADILEMLYNMDLLLGHGS